MEPWDGPACVVFTDGTQIGAVLDRNGLRPSRYWVTDDGLVVLASEVGVLDLEPASVVRKGRLQPGRMFLVDLDEHRIIEDDEIKDDACGRGAVRRVAARRPDPAARTCRPASTSCTRTGRSPGGSRSSATPRRSCGSCSTPMARAGAEPIGSMGTDSPIAALSARPRLLFDYFSQLFAQVTNPPLDAIREELVTSLAGTIGPEANLLDPGPASCRQLVVPFPVLDNDELAKIVHINRDGDLPGYSTHVVRGLYDVAGGGEALAAKIDEICAEVSQAIAGGRPDHRAVRPACDGRRGTDPVAAAHRRRPPPPGAREDAHPGRARRRGRRRPRGAPRRAADRLRRGRRSTRTSRWSPSRTSPASRCT